MKISDVCKKTELTERAVRLYVGKGLVLPKSQYVNGRTTLEFAETDVEILRDISVLRKAGFSIADILEMQKNENAVGDKANNLARRIEEEQLFRDELVRKLNEVAKRENVSWRKLASIMEKSQLDNAQQKICFPMEQMELADEEPSGGNIKKVLRWCMILIVAIAIIFVFYYNKKNHKILTTEFYIQDVIIEEKWKRNESYYISAFSVNEEDWEGQFDSPRTMQVSREYYEAFRLDGKSYESFEIMIQISYADAKAEEVLDEDGNIVIEKILEKERLMRDYCFVKKINNE